MSTDDSPLSKEHNKKEKGNEKGNPTAVQATKPGAGKQSGKHPNAKESGALPEKKARRKDSVKQPPKEVMPPQDGATETDAVARSSDKDDTQLKIRGCFTSHYSWSVSFQIGSLVSIEVNNSHYLLVSQPSGTYVTLQVPDNHDKNSGEENASDGASEVML